MPIKAIFLNTHSLSATIGALAWVFQAGHLSQLLGFQSNHSLDGTQTILIFALAFGLSMDYEIFLLSRIKEQFDATSDTRASVATGLQHTGWLISSAALLLATVLAAFSTARVILTPQTPAAPPAPLIICTTLV